MNGASRLLVSVLFGASAASSLAQSTAEVPSQKLAPVDSLGLDNAQESQLRQALASHDYVSAEKVLLAAIGPAPHTPTIARQLAFAGSVYFLNRDYLNAAVAWKKSDAITPLEPSLQFSLAMSYVQIGHRDWAQRALEALAAKDAANALYPYWLGRLDYDGHEYNSAMRHFQQAIALDPSMARAYDNLGLCYYYENQNQLAIENYEKAIKLDRADGHPSAWPFLNLAIVQQFLNHRTEAETNLREAIRLDPNLAPAYFQLGTVLEDDKKYPEAVEELKKASTLDASYAEPHMALARIYHRLGKKSEADEEVKTYLKLHPHSTPQR